MRTRAASVRSRLSHPVIDADGHIVELQPVIDDEILSYLEEEGGAALRERYLARKVGPYTVAAKAVVADAEWRAKRSWWGWPTENARDRATSHLPALLYERLDEMGVDFAVLYPSTTLAFLHVDDPELAGPLARATNRWLASAAAPYRDRLTIGGILPMVAPEVAVAELDYAVGVLGLKSLVISGFARRPLGAGDGGAPGGSDVFRLDTFGIDSAYDYDPFWARCAELGVAPVCHTPFLELRPSRSVSNYVYNRIGALSEAHESFAKSLFLGGVTRRFPQLRIGFLEGGVAWACSLLAELVVHWTKRGREGITHLDPAHLDVAGVLGYLDRFGGAEVRDRREALEAFLSARGERPDELDEFAAAGIERREDFFDRFVRPFYFGCEADDRLVAWAFNDRVNALGARLRPVFGSDIGHWDVDDMTTPLAEAYELVEDGLLGEEDFFEFTFLNAARLHGGRDGAFFTGTVCESAVQDALGSEEQAPVTPGNR